MNNIETMKLALEALEYLDVTAENYVDDRIPYAAITALRQAIEQAKQAEPVFWYRPCSNGMYEGPIHNAQIEQVRKESGAWQPLYTAPPPRQPLTDEEIAHATAPVFMGGNPSLTGIARAIESAHGIKEKNT